MESEGWRVAHIAALRPDLVPDITADREARFGAGNVKEPSAVHVADPDIFDRFGFGVNDRVSGLRLGDADKRGSRAEQKFGMHGPTSR